MSVPHPGPSSVHLNLMPTRVARVMAHLAHGHIDSVIVIIIIYVVFCVVVTSDGAVLGDIPFASPDLCELLC